MRRSPEQWQELVARQLASGLTQRQFCERHELTVSAFQYWKRRVGPTAASNGDDTFVQLAAPTTSGEGWEVELRLGEGVVVRISQR